MYNSFTYQYLYAMKHIYHYGDKYDTDKSIRKKPDNNTL